MLAAGADPMSRGEAGASPLEVARSSAARDVVAVLAAAVLIAQRSLVQHVAGVGHTNYISYCLMNDKGWAGGGIKAWRAEM